MIAYLRSRDSSGSSTKGFPDPTLLVTDGDLSVVTDASVYYRDDLLRSLRGAGVRPSGSSVAHLIAAAYRAWGSDCTNHLEGDFSFVVYDHEQRRMFAARDFLGRRPLYYVEVGDALVVSSSVAALVAHPACSTELDDVALAQSVFGELSGASRTPYRSVSAVPPATWLVRDALGHARMHQYWRPDLSDSPDAESFDAAS